MSFPLKPEKIKKAVKIFHNFARIHSTTLWKLIRVTGLLSFTISGTELTWCGENLRFDNDPTFSEVATQMIIQRDTSLTGWGAVCNVVQMS